MASTPKVNLEAKHIFARLLATENIWIQHKQVSTASFDLVNRVLTFPIWKEMSDTLYTMLAAHEVGHALYSPKMSVKDIGALIDPKNALLAGRYWNVVEDVRIEKLVKETYPGLLRTFIEAYRDLYDRGFFGTNGQDLSSLGFIDRINLHYKIGSHISLSFTPLERAFLAKIDAALTNDDAVEVARQIYEYAKHEHQTEPPQTIQDFLDMLKERGDCDIDFGFSDEGEGDGDDSDEADSDTDGESELDESDGDSDDESGEDESAGEADDESDAGDGDQEKPSKGKGKKPDEKDADDSDSDGEGDKETPVADKSEQEKKKPKDGQPASGKKFGNSEPPKTPAAPITQQAYDEKLEDLNDKNAPDIEYVTLPKPIMKNVVVGYKEVHQGIRKFNFLKFHEDQHNSWRRGTKSSRKEKTNEEYFATAERHYDEFFRFNKPKVDYIFQQFMMFKQAQRYKRTRQHKTGALDPLRMWAYKIDEDLFKSIAIVADDKNHALLFVVDWSGSMHTSMAGTLEQLMMLCMFCRRGGIPFRVMSLTIGGGKAFEQKPGNLTFTDNFQMRCYLSSEMTSREFREACINLFALMIDGTFHGGPAKDSLTGCTPLNEAIITSIEMIREMKLKADVVNAIFLTDGDANTVNGFVDKNGKSRSLDYRTKYVIDDREHHKVYEFDLHHMTPTMFQILRDFQDINVVGFYINGRWQGFFYDVDDAERQKLQTQFDTDGYVICTTWGYNELYITKVGDQWRVKETPITPTGEELGTPEYMEALTKNFITQRKNTRKQRMMLDRFVKMIA